MYSIEGKKVHDFWPLLDLATTFFLLQVLYIRVGHTFKESNGKRKKKKNRNICRFLCRYSVHRWFWFMMKHIWPRNVYHVKLDTLSDLSTRPLSDKIKRSLYYSHSLQRYTHRVLQTNQMKLIPSCVWAEPAVLGNDTKTFLKFKYEIWIR